jgi:hypothetical protein
MLGAVGINYGTLESVPAATHWNAMSNWQARLTNTDNSAGDDETAARATIFAITAALVRSPMRVSKYQLLPEVRVIREEELVRELMDRRKPLACSATLVSDALVLLCRDLKSLDAMSAQAVRLEAFVRPQIEVLRQDIAPNRSEPTVELRGEDHSMLLRASQLLYWDTNYDLTTVSNSMSPADANGRAIGADAVMRFFPPIKAQTGVDELE